MTLTDFLLARIAEDEAAGITISVVGDAFLPDGATFYVTPTNTYPHRWRRECEAKRRIVEMHAGGSRSERPLGHGITWVSGRGCRCGDPHPCRTLCLLALPYADHPDYRQEWRP